MKPKNSTKTPRHTEVLSVQVADDLLRRIVAKEFPAGTILPSERELGEHYEVSRTVVREAVKLLTARGLVTTNQGQGAIVGSNIIAPVIDALKLAFQRSNVYNEDILNTRLLIEPQIAGLAAQNATTLHVRQMRELLQEQASIQFEGDAEAVTSDAALWGNVDLRLHSMLAEASQNPVLPILVEMIVNALWHQRMAAGPQPSPDQMRYAVRQHQAIVEAVAARDAEAARLAMIDHLETTRRNIAEYAKEPL